MDCMRAGIGALWRDSPDQRLFHATLYERHDLRRAKSGTPDKKRPPTHSDGLRVVKPMLPDIPDTDPLDVEWEADTAAAIDRVVHHSVILEFDVPSYRTSVAQQRSAQEVNRQE